MAYRDGAFNLLCSQIAMVLYVLYLFLFAPRDVCESLRVIPLAFQNLFTKNIGLTENVALHVLF